VLRVLNPYVNQTITQYVTHPSPFNSSAGVPTPTGAKNSKQAPRSNPTLLARKSNEEILREQSLWNNEAAKMFIATRAEDSSHVVTASIDAPKFIFGPPIPMPFPAVSEAAALNNVALQVKSNLDLHVAIVTPAPERVEEQADGVAQLQEIINAKERASKLALEEIQKMKIKMEMEKREKEEKENREKEQNEEKVRAMEILALLEKNKNEDESRVKAKENLNQAHEVKTDPHQATMHAAEEAVATAEVAVAVEVAAASPTSPLHPTGSPTGGGESHYDEEIKLLKAQVEQQKQELAKMYWKCSECEEEDIKVSELNCPFCNSPQNSNE